MRTRRTAVRSYAFAAAAAALFGAAPVQAAPAPALEAAIKATYLYKFAPFVTWPGGDSTAPFTICIVGDDPFGAQLDRAVAGQSLDSRPFQIVRLDTITAQAPCAVAFLGGSRKQSITSALQAVHGAPILTVTDESDPPGIIAFEMQDDRVRFRIDQQAANDGGLTISSKLLSLALSVRTQR
ncbi:MAG: YfiR family protein [Asticcacaulis sp.]